MRGCYGCRSDGPSCFNTAPQKWSGLTYLCLYQFINWKIAATFSSSFKSWVASLSLSVFLFDLVTQVKCLPPTTIQRPHRFVIFWNSTQFDVHYVTWEKIKHIPYVIFFFFYNWIQITLSYKTMSVKIFQIILNEQCWKGYVIFYLDSICTKIMIVW